METKRDYAEAYAELGWYIFPVWWVEDNGACACGAPGCDDPDKHPIGKHPIAAAVPNGCWDASKDIKRIAHWWRRYPKANIGLHCGPSGILALDLDKYKEIYQPQAVDALLDKADEQTVTNLTPSPGVHLLYANEKRYGNHRNLLPPGIDVRSWGAYINLPPSNHVARVDYQWELEFSPFDIKPAPIPAKLAGLLDAMDMKAKAGRAKAQDRALAMTPDLELVAEALSYIPNWSLSDKEGGLEYREWLSILMAVHSAYPGEDGIAVIKAWSDGYEGEVEAKFASFHGGDITLGTLQHIAASYGWQGSFTERLDGFSPIHTRINLEKNTVEVPRKHITWPYALYNGRLCFLRENKDGDTVDSPIADFTATITGEITTEHSDKIFIISGKGIRGGEFAVEVPALDFGNSGRLRAHLDSVSPKDGIYHKMGDHLGPAIKRLTTDVTMTRRYNRTGWANGRFLIPGREPEGVEIKLDPKAEAYRLEGSGDLQKGLAALGAAMDGVGLYGTIMAAHVLLPPLSGLAGWDNERYGLFVRGITGSMKTTSSQLMMSVWGARFAKEQLFEKAGKHGATGAGIIGRAAEIAGLPFMIDNFKPNTTGGESVTALIHALMEGYTKSRQNRAGLNARSVPILCWPLLTGEDVPSGDTAALARLLIVELESKGGKVPPSIARAQALSQHLPAVGAAWLDALETNGDAIAAKARTAFEEARKTFAEHIRKHSPKAENILRSATNFALNYAGLVALCEVPAFAPFFEPYLEIHMETLKDLAADIATHTQDQLEASRYLSILSELVATERVHIRRVDPVIEATQDNTIGWYGKDGICLYPDLTRNAIESIDRNALNGMSNNALYKQLENLGALTGKAHTVPQYDPSSRKSARVLVLTYTALGMDEADAIIQELGLA